MIIALQQLHKEEVAVTDFFGTQGNELANVLTGNAGENLLIAGAGNDTVNGGGARDAIFGENGADILNGEAGVHYIVSGIGNDSIDGGADADELYGQDGDDILFAQNGNVGAIQFANGDVIVLHNLTMSQLIASDFILTPVAKGAPKTEADVMDVAGAFDDGAASGLFFDLPYADSGLVRWQPLTGEMFVYRPGSRRAPCPVCFPAT